MPSILFGSAAAARRTERGDFFCPDCRERRPFTRTVVRRRLVVASLAVLPLGRAGEFIECGQCRATYRPEVLAYEPARGEAPVAEYRRAIRRVLALMVVADGATREAEIMSVQRVFEAVTGHRLARAEVLREMEEVQAQPLSVARYLARVVGYLNEYGKEQVLRASALISRADGQVHPRETDMVRHLGRVLQLPPQRVEAVVRETADG